MHDLKINIKLRKKDILVSERSPCDGIMWTFKRNPQLDIIYYFGFLGYAEPKHILRVCLKDKIRIKFFSWLPINDKQTEWTKERGRW